MNVQNKKLIAIILFVLISFVGVAQGGGQPPPPAPPPPPGLPIDGSIYVLFVIAIIYGVVKKLKLSKS